MWQCCNQIEWIPPNESINASETVTAGQCLDQSPLMRHHPVVQLHLLLAE